jgi:signal transduction histidine kinase
MVAAVLDVEGFGSEFPGVEPAISVVPGSMRTVVGVAGLLGLAAIAASLVGAVACVHVRLRRASGDDRVRMLWVAWGALSIPGGLALCWVDYWLTGTAGVLTLLGVTILGTVLPLSIGAAILRQRLFDIELVLSRTLTYGALTFAVILTYAVVVQGLGSLVDDGGALGLVAVGLIAIAIQPLHARVRRAVERLVYGDRSDPYAALRRLSERLEAGTDPQQAIETVTASVREALRVTDARIELTPASPATAVTAPPSPVAGVVVRAPLVYQGAALGDLVVVVPPGRAFTTADRRVLDGLARHAAVVVNAVHLTLDLQASRAQLVTAREEERRRLRRDLHDGLGPSLAAIVLKLNAASSLAHDPAQERLLDEVRAEARAAVGDIRRLVDDLRPPALDEVGLIAALRQRAASLSRSAGEGPSSAVVLEVEGPDQPGPLPAAVEVAAYRIVTEAMTNVVRHSGAARCLVTVSVNGALELSVADNGSRPWDDTRGGVGWASMRERAAELGGTCSISHRAEGGTLVHVVLPLPRQPLAEAESR